MKKFALTVVGAAVFFTGLGAVVENAGAKGKSDPKALELIRKARLAIGGDAAINGVQSLRVVGQSTRTVKLDGTERTHTGETEIALQFPDKMMRSTKMTSGDDNRVVEKVVDSQFDVFVVGDLKEKIAMPAPPAARADGAQPVTKQIVKIKRPDGTVQELTGDEAAAWIAAHPAPEGAHTFSIRKKADGSVERGENDVLVFRKEAGEAAPLRIRTRDGNTIEPGDRKVVLEKAAAPGHGVSSQNEMFPLSLSLLMAAPQGVEVTYTYGGEGNVDGDACDIVNASVAGQSYKLYLSRSSNLPVMVSYRGHAPRVFVRSLAPSKLPAHAAPGSKETIAFSRVIEGPAPEFAEISVKFSNYRSTNGLNLPYRWTQTVAGNTDEVLDVTSYELNPANIAEKFKTREPALVRTAKPATK